MHFNSTVAFLDYLGKLKHLHLIFLCLATHEKRLLAAVLTVQVVVPSDLSYGNRYKELINGPTNGRINAAGGAEGSPQCMPRSPIRMKTTTRCQLANWFYVPFWLSSFSYPVQSAPWHFSLLLSILEIRLSGWSCCAPAPSSSFLLAAF